MRTLNYFLFYCILSLVFCRVDVMKCGDEVIENCVKYGTGEESNTGTQCKDKHFPFFHNLFCIPCDDPLYGQVGCRDEEVALRAVEDDDAVVLDGIGNGTLHVLSCRGQRGDLVGTHANDGIGIAATASNIVGRGCIGA